MLPIDVRLVQDIRNALAEELTRVHRDLGSGSQVIREDAAATGMNCVNYVGQIKGLQTALKIVDEVHRDLTGSSKKAKD